MRILNYSDDNLMILSKFHQELFPYVIELSKKFWLAPQQIANEIEKVILTTWLASDLSHVVVSGETENLTVYIFLRNSIIVCTPGGEIERTPLFSDSSFNVVSVYSRQLSLVQNNSVILKRLNLPKVALVNPSVKEVFPAPRLALNVSCLASYLRKLQKAEVHIFDMQLDITEDDLISKLSETHFQIIGVSISFGQMAIGKALLRNIFKHIEYFEHKPIVIAGNVIPAFAYEGLLSDFPKLVICVGEGEESICGLINHINGDYPLDIVPGILFVNGSDYKNNHRLETDMNLLPLPAMDTARDILKNSGVLILESSRGCSHSVCTFCPRNHKPVQWKGMNADKIVEQMQYYVNISKDSGTDPRIFLVDEDFFGSDPINNDNRIRDTMQGIIDKNLQLQFEADTRVDQIYSYSKNKLRNVQRIKTLSLCKRAGLSRLLLGVESASNDVLKRFNKGILIEEVVGAIRILTSIGIGIRIAFITFDPLMNLKELKENIIFLERKDILLKPIQDNELNHEELYENIFDDDFINSHKSGRCLYEEVCYMLASLEILMNCKYFNIIKEWEMINTKTLCLDSLPDYNMARYRVSYADPTIGLIADNCQKWIDRHFALDYCLKGMYKISDNNQRNLILAFRISYRRYSFILLKFVVWLFDKNDDSDINEMDDDLKDIVIDMKNIRRNSNGLNPNNIIMQAMEIMYNKMYILVHSIETAIIQGKLYDPHKRLHDTIMKWKSTTTWSLINPW